MTWGYSQADTSVKHIHKENSTLAQFVDLKIQKQPELQQKGSEGHSDKQETTKHTWL